MGAIAETNEECFLMTSMEGFVDDRISVASTKASAEVLGRELHAATNACMETVAEGLFSIPSTKASMEVPAYASSTCPHFHLCGRLNDPIISSSYLNGSLTNMKIPAWY